jgi:cytochrome c biogenesis protein CcmG, thiol:disulfide interchange protein DsbE
MAKQKTDRWLRIAICALTVALVYAIYSGIHQRVVMAGDSAPDFSVTTENGRTVSLNSFGGKVLVLNFWASWCPPCVEETPSLNELAREFAPKGLVVLAVSVDDKESAYRAFLQRFHPDFLTARDLKIHEDYGTFIYPETYIIGSDGRVLRKVAEGADWMSPEITQYIASLL